MPFKDAGDDDGFWKQIDSENPTFLGFWIRQ